MSALSQIDPKLFKVPEQNERVREGSSVELFVRIVPPQTGGPDCAVIARIPAPPGPLDQKDLRISEDVQLASILAEKILQGFAFHRAEVSSASGTVDVWDVPQPFDIPILGIDFQLTEPGYSNLSKDSFNEVASALAEGLSRFKTDRAWSQRRSPPSVLSPNPSPTVPPGHILLGPPPGMPPPLTPEQQLDAKRYFENGLVSLANQKYHEAISEFTEVIRIRPIDDGAYNDRGIAYEGKRDYDKAFADYNEAIRINPNDANTYGNRGNIYYYRGNLDKAISDYNEAIRLDPNFANAYKCRGNAYLRIGNRAKAKADFATARRLKGDQ